MLRRRNRDMKREREEERRVMEEGGDETVTGE